MAFRAEQDEVLGTAVAEPQTFRTEADEVIGPERPFGVPQTVIDGSQDLTSALSEEQRLLADEIFSLSADANDVKTDIINTSYWSDKLEMRFDTAFDLKESIGRQLFGKEDISRNQILQGIRQMEVERYRPPAFEAAKEPGLFSRMWHTVRDRVVTPRDIGGRIARGPFMALLLGTEEFPDLEQLHRKSFKGAVRDAYEQSGNRMVKSLAGRAQLIGEVGTKLDNLLKSNTPESQHLKSDLTEWGEYMAMAADQWYAENPESQLQIEPGTGFIGTTAQYILHPENILQGTLETVPMLLTAVLGHITGTTVAKKVGFGTKFLPWAGRVAGIAEPEIGEEYANARAQGLEVGKALAQSYTKAYTRAIIEEWVLGAKVKIFKGAFGRAASSGFAKKVTDLLLGGKRAYIRGAIEEGLQSITDRFWEMVWGDSEEWFDGGFLGMLGRLTEGASEAAAVGGLLEMGLSGVFAVSGQAVAAAGRVGAKEQIKRVNQIRQDIKRNETLDEQSKTEIDVVLDEKVEQVEAEAEPEVAVAPPVAEVEPEVPIIPPEAGWEKAKEVLVKQETLGEYDEGPLGGEPVLVEPLSRPERQRIVMEVRESESDEAAEIVKDLLAAEIQIVDTHETADEITVHIVGLSQENFDKLNEVGGITVEDAGRIGGDYIRIAKVKPPAVPVEEEKVEVPTLKTAPKSARTFKAKRATERKAESLGLLARYDNDRKIWEVWRIKDPTKFIKEPGEKLYEGRKIEQFLEQAKPAAPMVEELPEISKEKRIISKEAFEEALKRLRDPTRLRVGLSPRDLADAVVVGGYLIETGVRKFGAWSKQMVKEIGEKVRPHLQNIWERIQAERGIEVPVAEADEIAKAELRRKIAGARTEAGRAELQRRLARIEAGLEPTRVPRKKAAAELPPKLVPLEGETKEDFKGRVREAIKGFEQRVAEGRVREVRKKGPSPEASVRAERVKNAAAIKEAQSIDKTVQALRKEIVELEKSWAKNKKLEGTTQFDEEFDKFTLDKIEAKTKEIDEKAKQVNKKLRDRIQIAADTKGLSKKALSELIKENTGFTRLRGKSIEKKTGIDQLINLLLAVESARPEVVGHRRVLSQKTEDQIAAFKASLIKAGKLTEFEFNRILKLATSKGFGQVGLGVRQPKFIDAANFITQEEARDLLDRMHDSAQVIGITEPLNRAVEKDKEIKAELENVRNQPSSIGDPTAETISNRIRNTVFGTDFFDRLYSMRFYAQRLGDRMAAPVYKLYNSLINENQRLTRERQKVFKFLGTLPDFDKIAADNEALRRVSDAIHSKSTLEGRPEFPKNITKSELRLVAEIEKIFKVYQFHAKVGKFFQYKDDLTKIPQYLRFQKSFDETLDIYDTRGVDAMFDFVDKQNWGVVSAGYGPMRSVIRKISTHQMPDVAVGKSHIKVRGVEYTEQERNILQILKSYMRQMDVLAFLQPKIKAWVRVVGDNIEKVENQDNVRQVVSTFLNNLKKMNAEDGIIEEVMRKFYSQAITVRVLADPIKPGRNLLQNVAFSEDRGDLVNPNNKPLTPEDLEYLETYVQQDRVMMSDWAFAGEEPLNLPLIGQKRLGIDKITKWTQRHTQYPASDRLNRHWSFWAKINRVRNAFGRDQTLAEKMLEARFSDMQRSEQELALGLLARDGVNAMARYVAQVHTDNTHFLYAREARSPAEQTRVGKLVLNLFLFKRAAVEKAVLQLQKATQQGSFQSRIRAARVLVTLLAMSILVNRIWKELTGKKWGAYDFISFLEVNSGGLELASVEKIENVYNNMLRAIAKGDSKALAALPHTITTSADYFIPYYDLGTRAIEATIDEKNLDVQVLQEIRAMIDKEYRVRGRPRIERSLLEKFQFTFGGPGVDKKEKRKTKRQPLF